MQRIYNYGSFLQAYALKKMLEECGVEVEFVDYHPGKCILPSKEATGTVSYTHLTLPTNSRV